MITKDTIIGDVIKENENAENVNSCSGSNKFLCLIGKINK